MRRGEWRGVAFEIQGLDRHHVPLNGEAVTVLTTWRGRATLAPDALVFPSPGDTAAPLEDIKSAWLPLVKVARLEAFRFHDVRHTFASKLVQAGVKLGEVVDIYSYNVLEELKAPCDGYLFFSRYSGVVGAGTQAFASAEAATSQWLD